MLTDVVVILTNAISNGFGVVKYYAYFLLWILVAIDVAYLGIKIAIGAEDNIAKIVMRFLTLSFMVYFFNNLVWFAFVFQRSIVGISSSVAEGSGFNWADALNPDRIISFALNDILLPIKAMIDDTVSGWFSSTLANMDVWIMYGVVWFVVVICFCLVAIQISLALVEFYIMILMSLILFPFNVFEPTKFLGNKIYAVLAGQCIKIGMIAIINAIAITAFRALVRAPSTADGLSMEWLITIIALSLLLVFLIMQVPGLASSFISGTPALSATAMIQSMAAVGTAAMSAQRLMKNTPMGKLQDKATKAMGKAIGNKIANSGAGQAVKRIFKR